MRNYFMLDGRPDVKHYIARLKGILMLKCRMSEHVGTISSNAYFGFLMAL